MIYHITPKEIWKDQANQAHFTPLDFVKEGFVHCCNSDQVDGVLKRYFANVKSLLMLHINESKLDNPVRYEGTPGGEEFPHIYGRINKTAVEKVTDL